MRTETATTMPAMMVLASLLLARYARRCVHGAFLCVWLQCVLAATGSAVAAALLSLSCLRGSTGDSRPQQQNKMPPAPRPAPAPAARQPSLPLLRYFSLAPLHVLFSVYAVVVLPHSTPLLASHSHHSSPYSATVLQRSVVAMAGHPLTSLTMSSLALVCVQTWWGTHLRAWRKAAGKTVQQLAKEADEHRHATVGWKTATRDPATGQRLRSTARRAFAPFQEACILTSISTLVAYAGIVLAGAPMAQSMPHTLLLSLVVSLLAVWPSAQAIGWNQGREKATWIRVYSSLEPRNDFEMALLCPSIGAIVGCWLGAIPIPLDWDRPWQAWPTTCVVGASAGHAFGTIIAMVVCAVRGETQPTMQKVSRTT